MPKQIDIENVSEVVFHLFYNNFLALSSTFLYFGYIIIIKSLLHVIIQVLKVGMELSTETLEQKCSQDNV